MRERRTGHQAARSWALSNADPERDEAKALCDGARDKSWVSVPSSSPGSPSPEFFCTTALPDLSVLFGLSWDGPEPASSWNTESREKISVTEQTAKSKTTGSFQRLEWKVLLGGTAWERVTWEVRGACSQTHFVPGQQT